jgi:predicted DsbA family dithiol-disulfide isomerase
VVWKHYVVHPATATVPALATCAAQKQGKFWELEQMIWDRSWEGGRMGNMAEETMHGFAKDLGLNVDRFKKDMAGEDCKKLLAEDQQQLSRVGVRGTPAFFINGRFLSGAQPIDRFKAVIDEELQKANDAIKGGTKPEELYSKIIASGKKSL